MNELTACAAPQNLAEVLEMVAADRRAVDELIRGRLASDVVLVNQISHHIIGGGGKRMRPLLHLLCARAAGYRGQHHIQLAAVIEFIHTATLLHDDVVDESGRRRGQETAHRIWGNAASVLVGDFLYSRSFQMMVEIESLEVMRILADTTNTIAEGEVLQLMQMGNADLSVEDYFRVISDKTACLFSASARLGGVLAGRSPADCESLAEFGLFLGQAFQIADDVLDYQANDSELGKNIGDDLAEGKVTLPLILGLERSSGDRHEWLREAITRGNTERMDQVLEILMETDSLNDALEHARKLALKAEQRLAVLPQSPERTALGILARYAVDRSL